MESAAGPRWQQVGENAAATYERLLAPAMFAPWAPKLVELAGVQPGDRVLDIACGTGVATRVAAARAGTAGRVVGLDFSASMLAVARELPSATGAAIEWMEASALAMPLPDASFDVVLCQHGLQQMPDRLTALREMRRVLVPDGRFAACVWSRIEANPGMFALVEALQRHVGAAAADNRRAPFALNNADQLRSFLVEAGFRDVQVRTIAEVARFSSSEDLVDGQLSATPLSTVGTISDDVRDAIARDVRMALERYLDGGDLRLPMEAHVAFARV